MSLEQRGPLERWRGRIFVAVTVLVVTVLGSLGASFSQPDARGFDAGAFALLLVTPLAVVLALPRRPAVAIVASVGATGLYLLAGYPWGPAIAGPVVLLAAVVACGPQRRARVVAWAGAVLLFGTVVTAAVLAPPTWSGSGWSGPPAWEGPPGNRISHGDPLDGRFVRPDLGVSRGEPVVGVSPGSLGAGAAWTVVALLVAGAIRDRVARRAADRTAARQSAAERERTAVTAERLRIARELHDVLAHSLSGINVQAGVGLHLLDRNPEQARSALTSIRDTSRDALAEVRTVLGIVRTAPRTVTWDLSGLDGLAAQTRAEGLAVTLDVDAPGIPERVAGAIHRVVQESLTNIRRHAAGATRVGVSVRREGRTCVVVVSDDGRRGPGNGRRPDHGPRAAADGPGATPSDGGGYGLRGMRERVEALGGALRAGPDDAGWLVRATFPLPGDAAPAGTPDPAAVVEPPGRPARDDSPEEHA